MFGITVSQAAAICGGSVSLRPGEDRELTCAVYDSRNVVPDCLFVAYRGEKTDGHRFIASAFEKGAACALAEFIPEGVNGPVIICKDVQDALEKIIAAFREKLQIPIIGITGSVGKTTGKEMVSAVLSRHFKVHKTEGNLNNTIGMPVSLSGITREHEIAVLELGINHFGEMDHLGNVAKPDIMLFTRIGHAHLEFLRDLDGVFQAKTEVLQHMKPDAPVIFNGDDPYQHPLGERRNSLSYGRGENCAVRAENVRTEEDGFLSFDISFRKRIVSVHLNAFGEHMLYAALEGASVGFMMGLSDDEIREGIASYKTVGRRFACVDTGFLRLIDDCYNANPDSVMSSIRSLGDLPGRHVCILGEMLELGENSGLMHYDIGAFAKGNGVDQLFLCGGLCAHTAEGFGKGAVLFPDKQTLMHALPDLLHRGDAVLVKASLRSAFAEVSEFLKIMHRPCVFLDMDNTVLDFSTAEADSLRRALGENGIEADDSLIAHFRRINEAYWEKLEDGSFTREQVLYGRFERLFEEAGIHADHRTVQDRYEELLCARVYFMPGAEEMLQTLHDRYRLFIASNGNALTQEKRIAASGIAKYFEKIFVSETIGFQKPTREFFNACIAQIPGFDPSRAVIVGDSLTSDIRLGLNAGIRTVWYDPTSRQKPETCAPDEIITSLSELPALLSRIF